MDDRLADRLTELRGQFSALSDPQAPDADTILGGISDGIVALDNEWRLVYANAAGHALRFRLRLLPALRQSAQPQRIQPNEPLGVAVVISDLPLLERDELPIVERIGR